MNATRRTGHVLRFKAARKQQLPVAALRAGLRLASRISRGLCGALAETLFRTPPFHRRTSKERALLARGRSSEVWLDGRRLATWRWGEGPAILLVHGWGGHAARLSQFVDPLCAAGFSVIAFDAPAHGASDGVLASLPEFALAIRAVVEEHGPILGVVAHSMGGAATALAMRDGLVVPRAVFLAPPDDPERYSGRFANFLRVSDEVREVMNARLLSRYGISWDDVRISRFAGGLRARLLVFHDRGDFRVPLRDGLTIVAAWPGAELVVTRGFGHHKILRHPDVVQRAVRFLGGKAAAAPAIAAPEPARRRPASPLTAIRGGVSSSVEAPAAQPNSQQVS